MARQSRSSQLSLTPSLAGACAMIGASVSIALLTAVPMAPDELSTRTRAPDTFSRKITAPSAPRTLFLRAVFLISATASLIRLIGSSDRHPNVPARNCDRNVQTCALTAGIGCPPNSRDGARHQSVQRAVGLPIEKAICVLSRQSLFRNFSGLPLAEFGDKSLPSV